MNKTLILVDGANIMGPLRDMNMKIQYPDLIKSVTENGGYAKTLYFTARHADETGYDRMKAYSDWMEYNHVMLVTKQAKMQENEGKQILKGNMDVEIVTEAMRQAPYTDTYIFITGDGDFAYLFRTLRSMGKHVILFSASKCKTPLFPDITFNFLADELRRECDEYWNMNDKNHACNFLLKSADQRPDL